jgi:lipopolysaccharide transport system permease protein
MTYSDRFSREVHTWTTRLDKSPLAAAAASDDRPVRIIHPIQSSIAALRDGLRSLMSHKNLLFEMILLRLKMRYRQSLLGWIWAVFPPLFLMGVYTLIFSKIIGLESRSLPYALFIFSGLIPWMFFSTSVGAATAGMVAHRYLISRVAFPREVIPLSYVAAAFVDLAIGLLMLAAMIFYFGFSLTLHVFYTVPVVGLLIIFTVAIALSCAAFQARFRDIGLAMPLFLQVVMFSTPVVYSSAAVPQNLKELYFLNPLAILIEAFRQATVLGINVDMTQMIYCALVSIIFLAVSYVLFKRLDATLADVI